MSDPFPNPRQMFCPHCGTENPPYDFVHNVGTNIRMRVAYLSVVCNALVTPQACFNCGGRGKLGESLCPACKGVVKEPYYCKRILSVSVLACEITPGLVG